MQSRRSFLAGMAAMAAGGLSACRTGARPTFASTKPGDTVAGTVPRSIRSVQVVGDSLSRASSAELERLLNAAGVAEVAVDAEVGRRIEVGTGKGGVPTSGIRTVYTLFAGGADPDAWVIELGTNDIGSYTTPEAYGDLIDQLLVMLPTDRPVVWVNAYRPQFLELTDMFNLVLAQRMADRPLGRVADWYSMASKPENDVLRSDGIHPNTKGEGVLALVVVQALLEG